MGYLGLLRYIRTVGFAADQSVTFRGGLQRTEQSGRQALLTVVLIEQGQQVPDFLRIAVAFAHHVGLELLDIDNVLEQQLKTRGQGRRGVSENLLFCGRSHRNSHMQSARPFGRAR